MSGQQQLHTKNKQKYKGQRTKIRTMTNNNTHRKPTIKHTVNQKHTRPNNNNTNGQPTAIHTAKQQQYARPNNKTHSQPTTTHSQKTTILRKKIQ